ncbi:tRNA (adenosine(37)-N6)-threonylcarbamoyltransferase complex ATPase subunit type 1 TsaE [Acetobacteraceae bacterium]|nr:tRNA (adenosine(37)-N6)-threonylcarbamoyltransferase complex ATPase subunit type 1 TsaE [Acetobacteraceae bacterium]
MDTHLNSPILSSEIQFRSQKELEDFAALLAQDAVLGTCFALHGEMGVGKSTFARAFIRAYCQDSEMEVPSPSFALVQNYGTNAELFHYDLWRLEDGSSLEELDWDAAEEGIMLVEWPEHAGEYLPSNAVHLFLSLNEGLSEEAPRLLRWDGEKNFMRKLSSLKETILKQPLSHSS